MKQKNAFSIIIFTSLAIASCNSDLSKQPTIDSSSTELEAVDDVDIPIIDETADNDESLLSTETQTTEEQIEEQRQNKSTKAKTSAPSVGGKETIYISTYGANGKVWGHVTMNGNRGRGTIHDDDENSYTITVTRHGAELHGIDQNGREYIFRM